MSHAPENAFRFAIDEDEEGQRLDVYLAEGTGESRARIQALLRAGEGSVNGEPRRASYRLRPGDEVAIAIPEPRPVALKPEPIPLDVVYEDGELLVVSKPPGLVVHPGPGHPGGTLVNALMARVTDLSGIGGVLRPGIVHRLDRDTSGLLVVAKSNRAHLGLARQFAEHTIERAYVALVVQLRGPGLETEGTFDTGHRRHPRDRLRFTGRAGGERRAVTHYRVIERFGEGAMEVECRLETGRTHQIRVHFAEAGCPILGDTLYGGRSMRGLRLIERQALHARLLGFEHPVNGQWLRFEAPPPEDFAGARERLARGVSWRLGG